MNPQPNGHYTSREGPISVHHVNEEGVIADLHLYCGRNKNVRSGLIFADLGNPFFMKDETQRTRVCEQYNAWLDTSEGASHRRRIDRIALRVREGLKVALYCHCAPKRCHCHAIAFRVRTINQQMAI